MIIIEINSKTHGSKNIFIDGENFDIIKNNKWSIAKLSGMFYVQRCINNKTLRKTLLLHRIITGCPDNMVVDHINGNTLDNRKENLRICTHSQNLMNAKKNKKGELKSKGVRINKLRKNETYIATIKHKGKHIHIGTFKTEKEAAAAYNKKVLELRGEFSRLNIIESQI